MSKTPHVVIIGGGFGGLRAAKELGDKPVRVTLVDRTNHHTFQPLLYQVATAGLNPADIAVPIRQILREYENITVLLGDVMRIDVPKRRLYLEDGEPVAYDYLIVATGATHSYFGHSEFAPFAPGLKTIDEALMIRQRIFMAYEDAEREDNEEHRKALLTFVVVGGGPTGVEMAGALAEIARKTLANEFRNIDTSSAHVLLLEGGDRVLGSYVPELSAEARDSLANLGVEVRTSTRVTKVDQEGVMVGDERIFTRTVIWAAGVAASPLSKQLGVPLDKVGRVIVDKELSIPGHEEVYVIGDLAHVPWKGTIVPGVAQGAMQGAVVAAKNILAQVRGAQRIAFVYKDLGSMATIGRARAVVEIGRITLSGYLAWLAWLALHILLLIRFKNRVMVLIQWAWAYLTHDRGSRLIHGMVHAKFADPPVLPSKRGKDLAAAMTSANANP